MKRKNPYIPFAPEVIDQARQMDLLTYLQSYEPGNLVRVSSKVYCTKEHDSLKISNGKWYWWSRGFGGISALDYLIKVKRLGFVPAIEILIGRSPHYIPPAQVPKKEEPKELLLPLKHHNNNRVIAYLTNRGVDQNLIEHCIAEGILYESTGHHNAVFLGKDEAGEPRYGACRGTSGRTFKIDVSGSDKAFSFRLLSQNQKSSVHLFESAIDLLSYATLLIHKNEDPLEHNLLSLSGVFQPKKEIKESKIPVALTRYLKENPEIRTIVLHLDNDKTGRLCSEALTELLKDNYTIVDDPPPRGKDFNDFLLSTFGKPCPDRQREKVVER